MPKVTTATSERYIPEQNWGCYQSLVLSESKRHTTTVMAHSIPSVTSITTCDGVQLSSIAIGQRLWSAFKTVHNELLSGGSSQGTTASVTAYDGRNFITASVGNLLAFAAFYGHDGRVLSVARLNSELHATENTMECTQIINSGGKTSRTKIDANIALTRSLGNTSRSVSPNAKIDINSIDSLAAQAGIDSPIAKVQIISTCTGFMNPELSNAKGSQEQYLASILHRIGNPGALQENVLAQAMITRARIKSKENMTISVQTVQTQPNKLFLLGMFTGHATVDVSLFAADRMGIWFTYYCNLALEIYADLDCSVHTQAHDYAQDNAPLVESSEESDDLDAQLALLSDPSLCPLCPPNVLAKFMDDIKQEELEYQQFLTVRGSDDNSTSSTSSTYTSTTIATQDVPGGFSRKRSASPTFFSDEDDYNPVEGTNKAANTTPPTP